MFAPRVSLMTTSELCQTARAQASADGWQVNVKVKSIKINKLNKTKWNCKGHLIYLECQFSFLNIPLRIAVTAAFSINPAFYSGCTLCYMVEGPYIMPTCRVFILENMPYMGRVYNSPLLSGISRDSWQIMARRHQVFRGRSSALGCHGNVDIHYMALPGKPRLQRNPIGHPSIF